MLRSSSHFRSASTTRHLRARSVDAWAEYQATRVKLHGDENGMAIVQLLAPGSAVDKET